MPGRLEQLFETMLVTYRSWLFAVMRKSMESVPLCSFSLQVSVFENLFVFGPASAEITELLLRLIGDTQMEVRSLLQHSSEVFMSSMH